MTLKVDQQEWMALSAEDRQKIEAIIGENFDGETIEAGESGVSVKDVGGACQIACNVARAAAIAACNELPFGSGICISIANAAGDACLSRC